jgi:glutaconyl-CoA decarboxylase
MPTSEDRVRVFFWHAELEKVGIPVIAGIYGTNPASGG